jgi:hypothetical protein
MTKEEAQEIAKKCFEIGNKYGIPAKKKEPSKNKMRKLKCFLE